VTPEPFAEVLLLSWAFLMLLMMISLAGNWRDSLSSGSLEFARVSGVSTGTPYVAALKSLRNYYPCTDKAAYD
jgi:hypothetical protein